MELSKINTIKWIWASWLAIVVPLVGLMAIAVANGNENISTAGDIAWFLMILCLISIVILISATLRLKRWGKLLPVIGLVIVFVITGLSYFTYNFSKY